MERARNVKSSLGLSSSEPTPLSPGQERHSFRPWARSLPAPEKGTFH